MTREEIAEWSTQAILGSIKAGRTMEVMVDFYRATLEDAARAVCERCRGGDYPLRDRREWLHFDEHGDDFSCDGSEIHDLIAALEGGKR